jgi:hypothetical protein
MKSTIIWNLTPCNTVEKSTDVSEDRIASIFRVDEQAKQETNKKQLQSELCFPVSCLACSWTVKMEAVIYPETSVDFYQTKETYIPEDSSHQLNCYTNEYRTFQINTYLKLKMRAEVHTLS